MNSKLHCWLVRLSYTQLYDDIIRGGMPYVFLVPILTRYLHVDYQTIYLTESTEASPLSMDY
jgi:hypothetical protein